MKRRLAIPYLPLLLSLFSSLFFCPRPLAARGPFLYRWERPVIGYDFTNSGLSYAGPRNQFLARTIRNHISKTYLGKGEGSQIVGLEAIREMHKATQKRSHLFLLTTGETDRLSETHPTGIVPKLLGFFRTVSDRTRPFEVKNGILTEEANKPRPVAFEYGVDPSELNPEGLLPGIRDGLNRLDEITHFHFPETGGFDSRETAIHQFMTFRELLKNLNNSAMEAGGFDKIGFIAAVFYNKNEINPPLLRYWGSWGFKPIEGKKNIKSKDPNVAITLMNLDISDFVSAYLRKLEAKGFAIDDIPELDVERSSLRGWEPDPDPDSLE